MPRLPAATCALALLACYPELQDGQLLCTSDGHCPSRMECRWGREPSYGRCHTRPACDSDDDGDGFVSAACAGFDCDDGHPWTHPGADEICDGADNDCDGRVDEEDCTGHPEPPGCLVPTTPLVHGVSSDRSLGFGLLDVCPTPVTLRSLRLEGGALTVTDASTLGLDAACEGDPLAACEGAEELRSGDERTFAYGPLAPGGGVGRLLLTVDDAELAFDLAIWVSPCRDYCEACTGVGEVVACVNDCDGRFRRWLADGLAADCGARLRCVTANACDAGACGDAGACEEVTP